MRKQLQCFLLLVVCAAMPAWSQGFTFDYPRRWKLEKVPDKRNASAAPNAIFSSETDRIQASVSYLKGQDASRLTTDALRELVISIADDSVRASLEGRANPVAFGNQSAGMYVRVTDKNSPTRYKYTTVAVHRNGKDLAIGQFKSNDDDGAMLAEFLGIVSTVATHALPVAAPMAIERVQALEAKAAGRPGKDLWGAISVEQLKGDTDPYYGIGGGDSQVEAEKNAQAFCREAGAQRCRVQLSYRQCGAYAVSPTGFGVGVGSTDKAAEQAALGACKDKSCSMVVSDCNES